jgi:hypothetical protein
MQILFTDLVERAHHAALNQRPEALNRVGVDGTNDVLAGIVLGGDADHVQSKLETGLFDGRQKGRDDVYRSVFGRVLRARKILGSRGRRNCLFECGKAFKDQVSLARSPSNKPGLSKSSRNFGAPRRLRAVQSYGRERAPSIQARVRTISCSVPSARRPMKRKPMRISTLKACAHFRSCE